MHQDWEPVIFRSNNANLEKKERNKHASSRIVPRTEHGMKVADLESGETSELPKSALNFRSAVAKARVLKGWSQQALAHECNISINLIRDWESGKGMPPNINQVKTLSTKLGVQLPRTLQKKV